MPNTPDSNTPVCGTEPQRNVLDENECRWCHEVIYRTIHWPTLWKHGSGFATCIPHFPRHAEPIEKLIQ